MASLEPRKQSSFEHAKLEIERFKEETGMLRKLIGTGDHARLNGAFLFIFSMIGLSVALVYFFGEKGLDYCKNSTIPLIMAGLGYFAAAGRKPS
jgi:hypothetical protein